MLYAFWDPPCGDAPGHLGTTSAVHGFAVRPLSRFDRIMLFARQECPIEKRVLRTSLWLNKALVSPVVMSLPHLPPPHASAKRETAVCYVGGQRQPTMPTRPWQSTERSPRWGAKSLQRKLVVAESGPNRAAMVTCHFSPELTTAS